MFFFPPFVSRHSTDVVCFYARIHVYTYKRAVNKKKNEKRALYKVFPLNRRRTRSQKRRVRRRRRRRPSVRHRLARIQDDLMGKTRVRLFIIIIIRRISRSLPPRNSRANVRVMRTHIIFTIIVRVDMGTTAAAVLYANVYRSCRVNHGKRTGRAKGRGEKKSTVLSGATETTVFETYGQRFFGHR